MTKCPPSAIPAHFSDEEKKIIVDSIYNFITDEKIFVLFRRWCALTNPRPTVKDREVFTKSLFGCTPYYSNVVYINNFLVDADILIPDAISIILKKHLPEWSGGKF